MARFRERNSVLAPCRSEVNDCERDQCNPTVHLRFGDVPIGIVALRDLSPNFKSAMLWYVLGDKTCSRHGYTTRAVRKLLHFGFADLGLEAVNAWTVEANIPSIRVLERNNFRLIGRLRSCHEIDGQKFDRLLFDLLASEHEGESRYGIAAKSGSG